ncbi:MAG: STAS domain-containing protein, partial [Spirochaetota bacterium]
MNESIVRGERDGDALILSLTVDHLDAGNTAAFRAQATPLVQSVKRVVLDLTGVNFIDSAGLGALLSVMR